MNATTPGAVPAPTPATSPAVKRTRTHLETIERRQSGVSKEKGTPTVRKRVGIVTCPPGIVDAGVDSLYEIYGTAITTGVDYWTNLLARRATPFEVANDLLEWGGAIMKRKPPTWAHPNRIVKEWPIARLRDFTPADSTSEMVPTIILPPQAGHDSCIVDYAPGQSQVLTALQNGCERVLSLDWIGATQETKDTTVEDYLVVIREAIELVGGHANVVGDCQGGWLATIYAAVHPETVHTLSIAGAPIDFHAGEPLIHDWIRLLSPLGGTDFYRAMVATNNGVLPGEFLLTGFKLMQPEAETDRQLSLLAHVNDKKHLDRYRRFEDWFQYTQNIPGNFYLWIVEHLFTNNELLHGTLVVEGKHVDLAEIHCPLYLLAGANDHITPPPQVFALAEFVSTPEDEVTRLTTGGGHLGIFMGHESLRTCWTPVFADIAARSQHL